MGPKGFYHRQCYQNYTNITYLSRKEYVSSIPFDEKEPSTSCTPSKRLRSSTEFKSDKCIICQKDKLIKGAYGHTSTREPLTLNINNQGISVTVKGCTNKRK